MIAPVREKPTSPWEMYRAIVGIGAFCALVIVGVFQGTAARIRDNQEQFLAAAIAEVLPAAATTVAVGRSPGTAIVHARDHQGTGDGGTGQVRRHLQRRQRLRLLVFLLLRVVTQQPGKGATPPQQRQGQDDGQEPQRGRLKLHDASHGHRTAACRRAARTAA